MDVAKNKRILIVWGSITLLALGAIYFMYNPSQNGFFLRCPFKEITGYHCAGCGSQRAIHQLLHGKLYSAFRLNPLMLASLPLIVYGLGTKVYNFVFEKNHRVQLFYSNRFIFLYFAIAILFWIFRNIPYPPFSHLAPYK